MGALSGSITLVGVNAGACSLTLSDGNGQSQTLSLVGTSPGAVTEYGPLPSSWLDSGSTNSFEMIGPDNSIWLAL